MIALLTLAGWAVAIGTVCAAAWLLTRLRREVLAQRVRLPWEWEK